MHHGIVLFGGFLNQKKACRGGYVNHIRTNGKLATIPWVSLGKIFLADDKLTKSCIPLFVQELEITDSPAVRNNIMVAMTIFCVRYTALVDGCIAKIIKISS